MATLNAASRLREQVLKIPNTVLLISAGHPDRVIRFNRLPEIIQAYRKNKEQEKGFISDHTALNLDIGPDQECWRNAMREASQMARRDRPMPEPLAVAPDTKTDWALGPEDVPMVEMNIIEVVAANTPKQFETAKIQESGTSIEVPKIDKRSKAYRDSLKKVEA